MIRIIDKYGLANNPIKEYNAFIGISICSHYFSKKNVLEISHWAKNNVSRFLILIADDPQAYTFMVTKKLDFESALIKARKIGWEKYISISRWIQSSKLENIVLLRWRDISTNKKFLKILDSLLKCYNKNLNFENDIVMQIESRNNSLADDEQLLSIREQYFNIAAQYVINELAVMIYLQKFYKPSWQIQIYPLPMPVVLTGIYENRYNLDFALEKETSGYIHIEVE